MATKVRINLKGLKPNYIYAVTFYLWTDYGKGPASEEYLIKTLPSDPPSLVHLTSASPTSISLSWSRPNNIAINVTLGTIHILRHHIFGIFRPPFPPYVSMFLVLKIIKKWHFLTPLPPTSDYVIYEWSLGGNFAQK